mgnify:CR=1 FL=1
MACLAAFSYKAYEYRMKETFSKMVLFVYMFPQILIIIPIYLMMSKMGLINTYRGLVLCYIAFELPICIWTMQSYFETIPSDLIEAAEIDGLAKVQTLWHIFLPVALPGLAASGIMTFIGIWNNFLLANTLLIDEAKKTLPVVIADFSSRDSMLQGDVLASLYDRVYPVISVCVICAEVPGGRTYQRFCKGLERSKDEDNRCKDPFDRSVYVCAGGYR